MSKDVIIIGAGAVGCLTALKLAQQGWRVTLLDKGEVGTESSWAGGGILLPLLPWNYSNAVNELALNGAAAYPALCEELHRATGIDPEYFQSGMWVLPPFNLLKALAWCTGHSFPHEVHGRKLWLPTVSQVRNPRLMQALKKALELAEVEIRNNCAVSSLGKDQNAVTGIHTDAGELHASEYMLCAGAWSHQLLGESSTLDGHKPMRGQMLLFETTPGTLKEIIYSDDFYLIPRRDGLILAGSTVEDAGFDKSTTRQAAQELQRKAAKLLPQLASLTPIKHWSGLRPGSPGNVPTIGRHPQLYNLWFNTGHFRYGVTMAPASAEILVEMMR